MTLEKIILKTNTISRVDLDFMNHTHFEEVEMVEDFGQLITAYQDSDSRTDKDSAEVTKVLDAWVQHTQAHFKRENSLMLDTGFPAYPVHSGEHERVLEEMQRIAENWEANKDIDSLAEYVFSVWPEWFDLHINSMDTMTAKFAMMQGYKADSYPPETE